MDSDLVALAIKWRTTHGDVTDVEWELIGDLVAPAWSPGEMGRTVKVQRRRVVDAIFYAATGHEDLARRRSWRARCGRRKGRDPDAGAGIVGARSVRGASTVGGSTRGYDAGKRISGRKTVGVVDTLGPPRRDGVVAANTSDTGGIAVVDHARARSSRLRKVWVDGGFKQTFIAHSRHHHVGAEVVNGIHAHRFEVLPKRWIVERRWAWLMNNRRLQRDYERDPVVTEGFVWAAHSRYLLRRLTEPASA